MKTLTGLLKVFIPAFLFFMLVGFSTGYNNRQPHVLNQLIQQLTVETHHNQYFLVHSCAANHTRYAYSVDSNTWKTSGNTSFIPQSARTTLSLSSARINEYQDIITSLLGGATGGVTIQSIIKRPAKTPMSSHIKKSVIGFVAGVSGYALGKWAGKNYDIECQSALFTRTINNSDNWKKLEKGRLLANMLTLQNIENALLSQTGNTIYHWQEDPAFICSEQLKSIKMHYDDMVNVDIIDPDSQHYGLVDKMYRLHNQISESPEYKILLDNRLTQAKQLTENVSSNSALSKQLTQRSNKWDQACKKLNNPNSG